MKTLITVLALLASRQDQDPTIALWLFDEIPYPNVSLTDAGPLRADLRLTTPKKALAPGIGLVPGKFGNALSGPFPAGVAVAWPENYTWQDGGTSFASDRGNEVPERFNLGYFDWTVELWLRGDRAQEGRGILWELKNEVGPVLAPVGTNALLVDAGRAQFVLASRSKLNAPKVDWNVQLAIPTVPATLNDGGWHHVAFTYTAAERQVRHYLDGKLQPLPEKGGFLPLIAQLTSMRVAGDGFTGLMDEVRISGTVRYAADFARPDRSPAGARFPSR